MIGYIPGCGGRVEALRKLKFARRLPILANWNEGQQAGSQYHPVLSESYVLLKSNIEQVLIGFYVKYENTLLVLKRNTFRTSGSVKSYSAGPTARANFADTAPKNQ